MARDHDYESEATAARDDVALVFREVADGLSAGSLRFGEGAEAVVAAVPEELSLAIEFEIEDDEVSLELEAEWPRAADRGDVPADRTVDDPGDRSGGDADGADVGPRDEPTSSVEFRGEGDRAAVPADAGANAPDGDDVTGSGSAPPLPVDTPVPVESLARFQVFRDRADEWRWRLVHRNGNVIATSGEGYTRKHNARKGLRSVVNNAPDAEVVEDSDI